MSDTIEETDANTAAFHELLTTVNTAWEEMIERTPPVIRQLRIAETNIEVALVGERLAEILLPGLAWHTEATGPPVATVGAWDAEATGFALPSPIDENDALALRWVARRDGRPMAGIDWSYPGMLRMGNRYARRHLLGVSSSEVLQTWEAGAPLRRQLWWALGAEVLFAHAAAVGSTDGAALIMGASGSGKSTTSLACLHAGMGFISDDYCLVRGDPPVVHLLAATARVHEHELVHLPELAEGAQRVGQAVPKALLYLHESVPDRLVQSAPVRVVLLPEVTDERTPRLIAVPPAKALRLVAPAALWQMHVDPGRELEQLRTLLTAVPTYRLLLSPERAANPMAIQEVLTLATSHSG
jgi:hypothetical protein